jgi:Domain of unknown function (DUF1839)
VAARGSRDPLAVVSVNVLGLDASNYARHSLHAEDRVWVEKNCYIDVWIELIHAIGCEPLAMLPFTLAIDFEGDQWTFFKPPHGELFELYGLDCQELNCWRPLIEHAREHLAAGKVISTEADAWWLPDTSGTDYRRQHTKSTIVLCDLDVDARRLGYFHNAGYFTLDGEDFARTFRLDIEPDPAFMPFYAETIRVDRKIVRSPDDLRAMSRELLKRHLARRPAQNPVDKFAARFTRDLPELQSKGLAYYHAWAFATARQLGAAAELMARYLEWLGGQPPEAIAAFDTISTGAKAFILKAARAVNSKKPFDPSATFAEWSKAYDTALGALG